MLPHQGFQFVSGDLTLVHHTYQLRLATIKHLATLSDRSYKQTEKRLVKLEAEHYVRRLTRRPQKHIYTLGRSGVSALVREGFAPSELASVRMRQNELKEFGIRHAIFISDIHVRLLQLLCGETSLALTHWAEGPSLWDAVTTNENITIPIRPDAWFTLSGRQGTYHFFLEADRGTMAHSRMREKISGYAAYFQQQRHVKKYDGMKTFRVATITQTRGRAQGLSDEFQAMMPKPWLAAYPVIAVEDLTLATLMPELRRRAA